jgi:hypothetical protein
MQYLSFWIWFILISFFLIAWLFHCKNPYSGHTLQITFYHPFKFKYAHCKIKYSSWFLFRFIFPAVINLLSGCGYICSTLLNGSSLKFCFLANILPLTWQVSGCFFKKLFLVSILVGFGVTFQDMQTACSDQFQLPFIQNFPNTTSVQPLVITIWLSG